MSLTRTEKPQCTSDSERLLVSLIDVGNSHLTTDDEVTLNQLRTRLQSSSAVLWVSCLNNGDVNVTPSSSVAAGTFRTLRNEYPDKHIVTLSVEDDIKNSTHSIAWLIQRCFLDTDPSKEVEFILRNGHLNVGRLIQEPELDQERFSRVVPSSILESWASGPPLRLQIETPGMLDTLRFVEDTAVDLEPDEVEIAAAVWPISFCDVFVAMGRLGQEKMGFECARTVSRVGTGRAASFQPGDRVLMVTVGCMRSHPRVLVDFVFKLADSMSFHDAVAGMNPGMTA
jgi:hypothetical protein